MNAAPGTGFLDVVRVARRSAVLRAYATSPLRFLTPGNHGTAAWVYAASYGGGLLGGDALRLTVRVGGDASAFVSTQASTKVYRSADGTSVRLDAAVASGGQLVVWPDPVVCFAGSTYRQQQHVELAAGASLVLVDSMTSGRRASGERWQFHEYANRATIRYDGRLVLLDSTRLSPAEGDLGVRMGRFDVLAWAAMIGPHVQQGARRILAEIGERPIERQADALTTAAPLGDVGCLLRVAGRSVEQVGGILRSHLAFVAALLDDDPWARRW